MRSCSIADWQFVVFLQQQFIAILESMLSTANISKSTFKSKTLASFSFSFLQFSVTFLFSFVNLQKEEVMRKVSFFYGISFFVQFAPFWTLRVNELHKGKFNLGE